MATKELDIVSAASTRRRRRSWRWRLAALAAVVATTALVLRFAIGSGGGSSATATDGAVATTTATATRRTLTQTQSFTGTLDFGESRPVVNQAQGTVTAVPSEGTVVERGAALYFVDQRPVVLLLGDVPTYRDLDTSTTGTDVRQLEENLQTLGYDPGTVDDTFTATTADAVKAWENSSGGDGDGVVQKSEVVFMPTAVRIQGTKIAVGGTAQPGAEVVAATTTAKVVTASLTAADADKVHPNDKVTLGLPNGKSTAGTVTGVTTKVSQSTGQQAGAATGASSTSSGTTSTLELVASLDDVAAANEFDQASVSVKVVTARKDNVLTVPVTALVALAEGGYAVEVPDPAQARGYRLVPVTPGMYTNDFVEITGDAVREGAKVRVPK